METVLGAVVVGTAGLLMGSSAWPIKLMKRLQFEHWWFLGMLVGLILVPWTITFVAFPNAMEAFRDTPVWVLVTSNLFSISWGIANVLCGLCYVRIGVALTMAIVTGLGVSVASIMPLVFKGSGLFKNAPDITSTAGLTILAGVGVMLLGVALASLAGFGRDREHKKLQQTSGSFLGGLVMAIIAGVTSAGIMLAFVYSQGPIVARVSTVAASQKISIAVVGDSAMSQEYDVGEDGAVTVAGRAIEVAGLTAKAAADKIAAAMNLEQSDADPAVSVDAHNILAILPVQAVGLLGGALVNVIYPAFLMTRRKSWGVLAETWPECALAAVIGLQMCLAVGLANKGMLLLGVLGASVGSGIQQAMQMIGGQGLGFVSGEWRGVYGVPRMQMGAAILLLLIAAGVMAFSNTLQ